MIRIELPLKLGNGQNDRHHHMVGAKINAEGRLIACMRVRAALNWERGGSWRITLTRQSSGTLDGDNLQGSFKSVRDGVADALGMKDNDPRLSWSYAQERVRRGTYGAVIELEKVNG